LCLKIYLFYLLIDNLSSPFALNSWSESNNLLI